MGGCATKFKVLENDGDAPAPLPAEEVATKEVAAGGDDEANRQSLGHLFKEVFETTESFMHIPQNEVAEEKAASEHLKQENKPQEENETTKSPVADVPATDDKKAETWEDKKIEDVKPVTQSAEVVKSQNKAEEKVEEKRVVESPKTEKAEEPKAASDAVKPKA